MSFVDYIILDDEDKKVLEMRVKDRMKEGYMPTGGITVINLPGARFLTFFQAMYKFAMEGQKVE